jgi:hypothetical protein
MVKDGPKRRPETAPNRRPKPAAPLEPFEGSRTLENKRYKIKQNKDLFAPCGLAGTALEQVE